MSPWVLLRGLMRETRHWGSFPALFDDALGNPGVLQLDAPGNGCLFRQSSPASVAGMVAHYRSALLQQGCAPPYRILALSLGGMVAVEWARRHPQEVEVCVLINTSMRPFNPFHRRLRWRNYPALLALLASGVASREAAILRLTSNRAPAYEGLLKAWIAYQRDCPVRRLNALRQLLAAARYHAPATKPAMPLLLLASRGDRLVDPDCSRRIAQAWEAPIAWHPDAGHDLPLDDGAWIASRVQCWLSQQASLHTAAGAQRDHP